MGSSYNLRAHAVFSFGLTLTLLLFPKNQANAVHSLDQSFYMSYWTPEMLEQRWLNLSQLYPNTVSIETIGTSYQGNNITAIRLGSTSTSNPRRVFINSLLHANEWVSTMVATYIAERLALDAVQTTSQTAQLLSTVQVLIVPLCNPDGYNFSVMEKSEGDRNWRKNRSPSTCEKKPGVDLNFNWPVDFGGTHSNTTDLCSNVYAGPSPLSELETKALHDYIIANDGIAVHLDFNAYMQVVIGPWFHKSEDPPRVDAVDSLGRNISDAMTEAAGEQYRYSRAGLEYLVAPASGIMVDWTFSRGILSYFVALRPTSDSPDGYRLPPDQIEDTGREGLAAALEVMKYTNSLDMRRGEGQLPNASIPMEPTAADSSTRDDQHRKTSSTRGTLYGVIATMCVALFITYSATTVTVIRRNRLIKRSQFDVLSQLERQLLEGDRSELRSAAGW